MKTESLLNQLERVRARRGQVMVLFALMMPVLIGMLGLGIDAAHLFNARRDIQGAADLAALAGASQLPGDAAMASSIANDVAAENGFEVGVTIVAPYDDNEGQIEVEISEEVNLFFMPVLGISTVDVSARSVASHTVNAGTAILAKKDYHCWEGTVTFDSYNVTIDGHVHSNGGLDLRNSGNNTVTDKVTYKVGPPTYPHDHATSCLHDVYPKPDPTATNPNIEVEEASWHDWPVLYSRTDFPCTYNLGSNGNLERDGLWWQGGEMLPDKKLQPGIICVNSDTWLTLNEDDVTGTVTFVGGYIDIRGDDTEFTAYSPTGVLFFSDRTSFPSIRLYPDGGRWEGLIYNRCTTSCGASWLEGGQIVLDASSGFQQIGSIIGWAVRIDGSNWSLFGTQEATYEPMRLVE